MRRAGQGAGIAPLLLDRAAQRLHHVRVNSVGVLPSLHQACLLVLQGGYIRASSGDFRRHGDQRRLLLQGGHGALQSSRSVLACNPYFNPCTSRRVEARRCPKRRLWRQHRARISDKRKDDEPPASRWEWAAVPACWNERADRHPGADSSRQNHCRTISVGCQGSPFRRARSCCRSHAAATPEQVSAHEYRRSTVCEIWLATNSRLVPASTLTNVPISSSRSGCTWKPR